MKEKSMLKKWRAFFMPDKNDLQVSGLAQQPDDTWQEDYMVKKIQGKYSHIPETEIREAVKSCYIEFRSPEPGEKLVKCVVSRLNLNGDSNLIGLNK